MRFSSCILVVGVMLFFGALLLGSAANAVGLTGVSEFFAGVAGFMCLGSIGLGMLLERMGLDFSMSSGPARTRASGGTAYFFLDGQDGPFHAQPGGTGIREGATVRIGGRSYRVVEGNVDEDGDHLYLVRPA